MAGTIMTGPQGQPIKTPSGTSVPVTSTKITSPKTIPIGLLVIGAGVVIGLADTQAGTVVVWLLAAAVIYQAIKPGSGVVSKVLNSNPVSTTKKGS